MKKQPKVAKPKKNKSDKKGKAPGKVPTKKPKKKQDKKHPGSENLMPPWKPGQSGNPAGAPRGPQLTTILKERLMKIEPKTGRTYESLLVEAAVVQAIKGNAPIFRELWNRIEGKVAENINVKGVNPIADALNSMNDKKLGKHTSELGKWLKKLKK